MMDCWCSSEPVLVRDNPFQVLTEISPFRYCQRGAGSQRRQRKRGKRKRAVHRSRTTCRRHPLPPGLRFLELSCVGAEETFVRLCQHLLRQKKKETSSARRPAVRHRVLLRRRFRPMARQDGGGDGTGGRFSAASVPALPPRTRRPGTQWRSRLH
jgi:hypothetical protein